METLAESDLLSKEDRDWAVAAAQKDRENFAMGLKTVKEHGRLSEAGEEILEWARQWVGEP